MKIRKNDTVLVAAGKDRGKQGKVRQVLPREGRVIVEGINIAKRHMKPQGTARQAGIIEREAPLHISAVRFLCPKCHHPTRLKAHSLADGSKVRQCQKCGEVID
ncbi:MAG: 50S ribosomal protein L24 [Chloroflexi bacterium]|nr:50S ribosomal protein L24 [Chloroflexota bacterium]